MHRPEIDSYVPASRHLDGKDAHCPTPPENTGCTPHGGLASMPGNGWSCRRRNAAFSNPVCPCTTGLRYARRRESP